jgi:hypothetical protein
MQGEAGLDNTGPAPDGRNAAGPNAAAQDAAGPGAPGRDPPGPDAVAHDADAPDTVARRRAGRYRPEQHGAEFGDAGSRHHTEMPDLGKLAQDWITLWQSELSAMAADPEIHESWQTMIALWAGTMAAMLRGLPRDTGASPRERARARSGSADAPGAAPVAAAPDARDAEIERLARHVTALERRLAELERGGNPAVNPKRRPGRKPRR